MKSIDTRKILRIVFSLSWLIAAAAAGCAYAGDYYTYRDADGRLVISNTAPPPGRKIINKQTLPEVTDREIAEARAREDAAALDNRLSRLETTVGELAENSRAQSAAVDNLEPGYGNSDIAVSVTNGPVIIGRPLHRPTKPPTHAKNDAPGRDPRARAPAAPPPRAAGRMG